jgi:flagellar FliL protein
MAEENDVEAGEKKKSPVMMILIAVLASVLVSVGAVMGTLYFTGFFSEETELEQELARLEAEAEEPAEPAVQTPQLMETPDPTRLDTLYYEMTRPLTANVSNSRKVMQITVAVMTHYDQVVIDRIVKHELLIRSAMLAVVSAVTEEDFAQPDFKDRLAEDLKLAVNSQLEVLEDFGGVEKVLFVEYLVQ